MVADPQIVSEITAYLEALDAVWEEERRAHRLWRGVRLVLEQSIRRLETYRPGDIAINVPYPEPCEDNEEERPPNQYWSPPRRAQLRANLAQLRHRVQALQAEARHFAPPQPGDKSGVPPEQSGSGSP